MMTVHDVAEFTGWTPRQVWQLTRTGSLPPVRVGRRIYFNRRAVEEFLGMPQPVPPPADPDIDPDLSGEKDARQAAPLGPRLFEVLNSALALSREDRAALLRLLQSEGPTAAR